MDELLERLAADLADRLADQLVDRVVERLAETLLARLAAGQPPPSPPATTPLVDAAAIAELTGLTRSTIYRRAIELGAVKVGTGPKPRLRFDPQSVLQLLTREEAQTIRDVPARTAPARRRRRDRSATGNLLPIRGRPE
jgi:hypothetical protein